VVPLDVFLHFQILLFHFHSNSFVKAMRLFHRLVSLVNLGVPELNHSLHHDGQLWKCLAAAIHKL